MMSIAIANGRPFGFRLAGAVLGACISATIFCSGAHASGLTEVTLRKAPTPQSDPAALDSAPVTRSIGGESGSVGNDQYSNAPVLLTVSLGQQQLSVYKGLNLIHRTRISSGKKGHATPTGIFSILEKRKYHESNLYSSAPMPFMQRLTWSGIALHQGRVPPFPASHGCVRIPKGIAKTIYGETGYGTHVILADEDVAPRPVSHRRLFQPAVHHNELVASLRPAISDIPFKSDGALGKEAPLRIYATRTSRKDKIISMQRMLNSAGFSVGEADGIYGSDTIRAVKTFQHLQGLRVTGAANDETFAKLRQITRSGKLPDGKLYIRQKHKPVFETVFSIKDANEPLGTHLLLLGGLTGEQANWLSVAIPTRLKKSMIRDHDLDTKFSKQNVRTTIRSVLDRLEIPQTARDFISDRLAPGTSFAISDNGLGTETGNGTDFIVQIF